MSKPKPTPPGLSGAMIGAIIASLIAVVLAVLLGVFLWRKIKVNLNKKLWQQYNSVFFSKSITSITKLVYFKAARYSRMDEPRGVISTSSQSEAPTFDRVGETSGIAKGQRSYGGVAAGSTGNSEVV